MKTNCIFAAQLLVAIFALLTTIGAGSAAINKDVFEVLPYVQMGNNAKLAEKETADIVWFTERADLGWRLETKQPDGDWTRTDLTKRQIFAFPFTTLYKFRAQVDNLKPGITYDYRIIADGNVVFSTWAKSRKSETQPYSFIVFGDCGSGSVGQKLIAYQCYKPPMPDFIVMPGDIVYSYGTFNDYLHKFFPVYNSNSVEHDSGAPLLRSIPFIGVIGNHDVASPGAWPVNLEKVKGALAYFYVWNNPHNGPIHETEGPNVVKLTATDTERKQFYKSAGDSFPRGGVFSFDFGNSHWVALDGNAYMNWRDPGLRKWVEDDLNMSHAIWKFAVYHQPAFSYDSKHSNEERMRLMSDLLQRSGVDIIFTGHAHDYQRTKPMLFKPVLRDGLPILETDGKVPGGLDIDSVFNGIDQTKPRGVIHIVTGAGGASLYGPKEKVDPKRRSFLYMAKFISDIHSFTRCAIDGEKLELSQISSEGAVLDHIVVTKH